MTLGDVVGKVLGEGHGDAVRAMARLRQSQAGLIVLTES